MASDESRAESSLSENSPGELSIDLSGHESLLGLGFIIKQDKPYTHYHRTRATGIRATLLLIGSKSRERDLQSKNLAN